MFTKDAAAQISSLQEAQLIQQIGAWLGPISPPSPKGMGDDCAIVKHAGPNQQILTTDSLTYQKHFDDSVSPEAAGAKLIKRNLSDIAAMGGCPSDALLSLLCGPDLEIVWLECFIAGLRAACESYNVNLIGGDVSELASGQFTAVLAQTGYLSERALLRTGGQNGDQIYVTGALGGSIQSKHYAFAPRLEEGQWLAEKTYCTALMDLTDGLAKDLRALLPEGSCAAIDLDAIPLSTDAKSIAIQSGNEPLQHAFTDGEDYELLFLVNGASSITDFENDWRMRFPATQLSKIGQIEPTNSDAAYIDLRTREPLPWQQGFEHLSKVQT